MKQQTISPVEREVQKWREANSAKILSQNFEVENLSPISLYQNLYQLVHGLKATIGLSVETKIQAISLIVHELNEILLDLSAGKKELNKEQNITLRDIALELRQISALHDFLKKQSLTQIAPTPNTDLLKSHYNWESFAKARLNSCVRHGYVFFEKRLILQLLELPNYDHQLHQEIAKISGTEINRKISAQENPPANTGSNSMSLEVAQLIAVPKSKENSMMTPWVKF